MGIASAQASRDATRAPAALQKRIVRSSYGEARPRRDFPWLANEYLKGRLKLDELITNRIRLDQINDGFASLARGEGIRTVVMFD